MFEKILKYIVYALTILIGVAFITVIYGMYTKITSKSAKKNLSEEVSFLLEEDQEINTIQVIDKNRILVTIKNDHGIQGIIYDINKQKIIQRLNK